MKKMNTQKLSKKYERLSFMLHNTMEFAQYLADSAILEIAEILHAIGINDGDEYIMPDSSSSHSKAKRIRIEYNETMSQYCLYRSENFRTENKLYPDWDFETIIDIHDDLVEYVQKNEDKNGKNGD